jgi:hypothetical protein
MLVFLRGHAIKVQVVDDADRSDPIQRRRRKMLPTACALVYFHHVDVLFALRFMTPI